MSNVIEQIRSGSKDAVKEVYKEHAKDVYNFAKSITGTHETALEATKQTFMELFNRIQKGENPSNIRTAALKIAYDQACAIAMPASKHYQDSASSGDEPVFGSHRPRQKTREELYAEVEAKTAIDPTFPEAANMNQRTSYTQTGQIPSSVQYAQPRRIDQTQSRIPLGNDYYEEYDNGYNEPAQFVRDDIYVPKGGMDTMQINSNANPEYTGRFSTQNFGVYNAVVNENEDINEEVDYNYNRRGNRGRSNGYAQQRQYNNDYYYEDEYADGPYDDYDDNNSKEDKPKRGALFVICIIINIILILVLLWFLGGLLINLGVLPKINLGYDWFNSHVFPLF